MFLQKVWVDIFCAPETKFNIEPDFTYKKICKIDFHQLEDQTIDKMFAKMIHKEAVEFGRMTKNLLFHRQHRNRPLFGHPFGLQPRFRRHATYTTGPKEFLKQVI